MTRTIIPILLFCLFLNPAFGAEGDTTFVNAHQQTDLTWYRSYRDWAVFPDDNRSWQEITLKYTMGCASGGCSDWDYTTLVNLMLPTGVYDSTVLRIDTLGTNPLVLDTVWNRFEVIERMELCKVITPYGGNLSNSWTRTFYFDVSDYYPLLKDSVEIEVFYQGWSSGFSATLEFEMIEGDPVRPVYKIENLYRGKFNYFSPSQFEGNFMPSRNLILDAQASQFNLKMAPSGHGFVNSLNCAEFCERDYYVYVDGQLQAQQAMWRDDCGLNGLWPQAGTWLYDRANWCPGDRVTIYNHELDLLGKNAIDIDIEAYNYTVPSGQTPANYNMSATLFHMGDFNRSVDLALHDIISPSTKDEYARFNPVCSKAVIRLRNEGADTITSALVSYGLKGSTNWQSYTYNGVLAPLETVDLSLPMDSLMYWEGASGTLYFMAQIEQVNGSPTVDEFDPNNRKSTEVALAEQLPPSIRFELRTNNAASETFWRLEDAAGNILYSGDNLSNSTTYRDTFDLDPGCYMLLIGDRDEDGLSFFANNDGSGRITLRNVGGDFFYENINPNFGTEYRKYFTVGYGLNTIELRSPELQVSVYPNPNQGQFQVDLAEPLKGDLNLKLRDLQGRIVRDFNYLLNATSTELKVEVSSLTKGFYLLELEHAKGRYQERILIEN